jgi:ABC-type phosphate transport system substrate-binding protein
VGRSRIAPLIFLLLAACTPTPTPTPPPPTPRIATTPYFEPLVSSWISAYAAEQSTTPFELVVFPVAEGLDALAAGDVDLLITAEGALDDGFATPLRTEGIGIILHPTNQLRDFSLEDLRDILSGRIDHWEQLDGSDEIIQLYLPLPSEPLRTQFERLLALNATSPTAHLAPSPAAMLSLVREDPGAIGLLPHSLASDDVRIAGVNAVTPSEGTLQDGRYPLTLEIVATAPSEPEGTARDWLAWLQSPGDE